MLDLRTDQIKDEIARNGKIFRSKAQVIGDQAVDIAYDARAVMGIKAKLATDPKLSVWSI
jgi:hypothetical protein